MLHAALTLVTAPFPLTLIVLTIGAVGGDWAVRKLTNWWANHEHDFRMHPSGVSRCTGCPAMRDRAGQPWKPQRRTVGAWWR